MKKHFSPTRKRGTREHFSPTRKRGTSRSREWEPMPVMERLNSAFRGALWLVRGGGLRHRLHSLEGRLRQVDARVLRTAQQLDANAVEARREAQRAAWLQ